jgi:hypothetical protein
VRGPFEAQGKPAFRNRAREKTGALRSAECGDDFEFWKSALLAGAGSRAALGRAKARPNIWRCADICGGWAIAAFALVAMKPSQSPEGE